MFIQILLSALCMQFAVASDAATHANHSTQVVDNFIPYTTTSVNDNFAWRLFQKFTSSKGYKNVIISPISLKLVLALLYEGAGPLAETEFQNILRFPVDKEILRKEFADLLDTLVINRENYIINIGTQLFLDHHLTALPDYKTKASKFYHADVTSTNFSNPQGASTGINLWVEYLTNGRIKTLVTPDDVENAVLLLANTIYFKGMWVYPFQNNESFTAGFQVAENEIVNVKYMQQVDTFYHFESTSLGAQILRLPYLGGKFGIYFILPRNKNDLSRLIDDLDVTDLTFSVRLLEKKPVKVIMPKFRFDFQAKFSNILREFGFDNLFRGIASLPGIVKDQEAKLVVTDILQKSGIDVNEEGSVVYTASQVQIGNKFGGQPIHTFNMSHPFLFFIEEQTTNKILFIGKVENPLDTDSNFVESRFGFIDSNQNKVPLAVSSDTANPGSYNPSAPPTLDSQFDIKILKNAYGTSKNVLLSPSSIKVSLAMLGEAAVGPAVEEIYKVLGIPQNERTQVFSNLISELSETQPHSSLKFQNALFVSDTKTIKNQYKATVQSYFKALVKQINYSDKERAASQINGFVKSATNGFIPSILTPDEIDINTDVILTNVLYFKADWLKIFDSKLTTQKCFQARTGCINVKFMHIIDTFYYAETSNAYIVKLEYAGNSRAMLLVVPKAKDGLENVLSDLEQQKFKDLLATLSPTEVELLLPKFEIDFNKNLIDIFEKMGLKQIFSPHANLSNLLEGGAQSMVDSFIHKTKIEVGEEGTEASAVSLVSVIPLMGTSNPKVKADHPFVFFIYNTKTFDILFEGILNEPEPAAPEGKPANTNQSPLNSQVKSDGIYRNNNYYSKLNQNPSDNSN